METNHSTPDAYEREKEATLQQLKTLESHVNEINTLLNWCIDSAELERLERKIRQEIRTLRIEVLGVRNPSYAPGQRVAEKAREALRILDKARDRGHQILEGRIHLLEIHTPEEIQELIAQKKIIAPRRR